MGRLERAHLVVTIIDVAMDAYSKFVESRNDRERDKRKIEELERELERLKSKDKDL